MLKYFQKAFAPNSLKESFDVIVGTSFGGILAAFLCCTSLTLDEMQNIIKTKGPEIFKFNLAFIAKGSRYKDEEKEKLIKKTLNC